MTPDFSKLFDWKSYIDEARRRGRDTVSMALMRIEARAVLERQEWCDKIVEEYVGMIHPDVVGVFLFRPVSSREHLDEWIWVIVGNLPSAYMVSRKAATAAQALENYIAVLWKWIDAVERGAPANDAPDVPGQLPRAEVVRLKAGLRFMDQNILPWYAAPAVSARDVKAMNESLTSVTMY